MYMYTMYRYVRDCIIDLINLLTAQLEGAPAEFIDSKQRSFYDKISFGTHTHVFVYFVLSY